MKTFLTSILVSAGVFASIAFIVWCGGCDFDHRSPIMGWAAGYAVFFSALISCLFYIKGKEE